MSFKVVKLTVGKGKTTGDEKAGKWEREYYELEAEIQEEKDIEPAKNSLEFLVDTWLKGESIFQPQTNPKTETKQSYDPEKIKWTKAEGANGPYERSEDINSLDHKTLLKDLAAHKGKLQVNGLFYWTFQNGYTIGRKTAKN